MQKKLRIIKLKLLHAKKIIWKLYMNACTFINARGTTYLPSRLRRLRIKQNLSNLLIFSYIALEYQYDIYSSVRFFTKQKCCVIFR